VCASCQASGLGQAWEKKENHKTLHNDKLPRSGFVVRPRWCFTSTCGPCRRKLQLRSEGNCVAVKRGGSNWRRIVGLQEDERDSAGWGGEPATKWRSRKRAGHAGVARQSDERAIRGWRWNDRR